jgi:hypothetical protein
MHAHSLAIPSPLHVIIDNHRALPVAVEPSWWPPSLADVLSLFVGLATLLLGAAAIFTALATIVANDYAQQEHTRPVCDLEDVDTDIVPSGDGQEAHFHFTFKNDGGSTALDPHLMLEEFDGVGVNESVYLGAIAGGIQRRYAESDAATQPAKRFKLPNKPGGYVGKPSYVLVLRDTSLLGAPGEAYIEDRFPSRREAQRPRTTPPAPVARGPKWLLWAMRRLGMKV